MLALKHFYSDIVIESVIETSSFVNLTLSEW